MGKIFCLMGKSCVGKDTIFRKLMKDRMLNLKPIVTYTTRPKRLHETDGVEYNFIEQEKLMEYKRLGKIIEVREYDTVNGKWYYSTIDDGKIDLDGSNYLIIVTLEGYKKLDKYFGKDKVIPFHIEVNDETRLERAINREKRQKNPNYNELCRRFIADNKDFNEYKLKSNGITKDYPNYNSYECYRLIRQDILNHMK